MKKLLLMICALTAAICAPFNLAQAGLITYAKSGNYTITGANYDLGGLAVVGTDNDTGQGFVVFNNVFTSLNNDPNWISFKPIGQANGIVYANEVDFAFGEQSSLYVGGSRTTSRSDLSYTGSGPNGGFGGTLRADGTSITGTISAGGAVTYQSVPRIGGELAGSIYGVAGSSYAGFYTTNNGFGITAVCGSGGSRQTLDAGSSSASLGVDGVTKNCLGNRNGIAGWWDSSGNFHAVPSTNGTGTITGDVTSGAGGLLSVKDNQGNLYVSDGLTTMPFFDYLIALSITPPTVAPPDIFWVASPTSVQRWLVYQGSIETIGGDQIDFARPLAQADNAVPEPETLGLVLTAILFLTAGIKMGWIKPARV